MKLEALIILARAFCPWQPDPPPPTVVLPDAAYEELEERYGFDGTLGLTRIWYRSDPAKPVRALVWLREGADERVLCHEWGHAVEGNWHP